MPLNHDDVIKWKHFPRYWPFVRGIHRSWMNSPHKGQWRRALMFSLICAWINRWINNPEAGNLRRHRAHHDVTVMHFRTIWSLLALYHNYIDGLAQDCSNSIANALELLKSCTKPSICSYIAFWQRPWLRVHEITHLCLDPDYFRVCLILLTSFMYWKSGASDLLVLTLFVLQCTDYK